MVTTKIEIQLSSATYEEFEIISRKAKLSVSKLMSVLIEAFIKHGGKVFTGEWEEGPGIRLLPDWPRFSSGVIKIQEDEMSGRSL